MRWMLLLLLALSVCAPLAAQATPLTSGGRVFTVGSGLIEAESYLVRPDGRGGVWVGHVAGGRGIFRRGGLSHIRDDGSFVQYRDVALFQSCPSVDALAPTADGGLWVWLSGIHDYGHNDHGRSCVESYGVPSALFEGGHENYSAAAFGYISAEGSVQIESRERLPQAPTAGMVLDALGRLWVGTAGGVAVREADGSWRPFPVWGAGQRTLIVRAEPGGRRIAVGTYAGDVALIEVAADGTAQIRPLPSLIMGEPAFLNDLTFTPDGIVAAGNQLYRFNEASASWGVVAPLGANEWSGQRLAYTGGTVWAASPAYGLQRLVGTGWQTFAPGSPQLVDGLPYDLFAASDSSLLIATSRGAALFDTMAVPPDPSTAQRAFDVLWQRTNTSGGSWLWGPRGWAERYEPYTEGPGGIRYVRYYDKTRMEVNNPSADPSTLWYVTNGLLVVELVTGRLQYGNDASRGDCPQSARVPCPAQLQVAGDISYQRNQQALRYSSFGTLLGGVESRVGQPVAATLQLNVSFEPPVQGSDPSLASATTTIANYDSATGHNIPQVFWDFLGRQPTDWLFAFGHPISEPYWTRTEIGGLEQWVLLQLFERRTLTYTPSNPAGWQVEMGNVGQHYFGWRYTPDLAPWQ